MWIGTQAPQRAKGAVCALTGFAVDKVCIHDQLIGGGFGRRGEIDMVSYAIQIAKLAGVRIMMIWTREVGSSSRHVWLRGRFTREAG